MNNKVTVILISHNDEKHIDKAILSVLNQTLKDIELICVDDFSSDKTLNIMKKYEALDQRIKVISLNVNGGILNARYQGMLLAKSNYIMFLDSDDYLEENACEIAYNTIVKNNYDCLLFGTNVFFDESVVDHTVYKEEVDFFNKIFNDDELPQFNDKNDIFSYAFEKEKLSWNVWNKIYSTNLVNKVFKYYEGEKIIVSEDILFSSLIFIYTERFGKINNKLYNYRLGNGISTSKDRKKTNNENDMDKVARSYLSYLLVERALKKDNYNIDSISRGLSIVKKRALRIVLYYYYYQCDISKIALLYEKISKYIQEDTFLYALVDYSIENPEISKIDLLDKIKECSLINVKKKKIKNIGMFYHRMTNGGVERVMSLLTPILQKAGYQVTIITEDDISEFDYELPPETRRVVIGNNFSTELNRFKTIKETIAKNKIDIIIYHAWVGTNLIMDSLAIRSEKIPLITYMHNNFTLAHSDEYFYHNKLNLQHKIYALSNGLITLTDKDDEWWKSLGYKTFRMPNPCTYKINNKFKYNNNNKNILWIARIAEEKQFDEMVEIAKIVHRKDQDIKFYVLGKCETDYEFDIIKSNLNKEKLSDYIFLEGYKNNVEDYYRMTSALLLTSKVEGFSMTLYESKSFGIPTIAYKLNNLDNFNKENGVIVVDQYDRISAAKEILKIVNDYKYRNIVSKNAKNSFKKIYHDIDLSEQWNNIIKNINVNNIKKAQSSITYDLLSTIEIYENKKPTEVPVSIVVDDAAIKELTEIKNSTTWKAMRILTFIPRTILDFIKNVYNNGLSYGTKLLLDKICNINNIYHNLTSKEHNK